MKQDVDAEKTDKDGENEDDNQNMASGVWWKRTGRVEEQRSTLPEWFWRTNP